MILLKSIIPRDISVKLDKKLKDAITSTMDSPAQEEKKSNTIGKPLNVNKKHTVTEIIKAITWFLVRADINKPIERYPPAIKRLPI